MKKYLKIAIISSLCLLVFGCQSVSNKAFSKLGYEKIDQANQQIEAVKADAANQIAANNVKIETEKNDISTIDSDKAQSASNYLFNAEFALTTLPTPLNRTDLVVDTNIKSAAAFLPPPTTDAIQNALTEVKKELDIQLTTNADLAARLQSAQTQAQILNAQTQSAQTAIDALKIANTNIVNTTNDKVNSIQAAKDATTKNLLSTQQQALDNAKDVEAMKLKIMWITGIIALACIAGSIWSPIFKTQLIEGAALFGFITLCIPYITPLILGIAGSIILILILITIGLQHKTAVNTIAASTNMPVATVAKAVANNTTALLVNDPTPILTSTTK